MVIVAAVDKSDGAASVVDEAVTLADAFGDTVHVVHVLTQSEFVDLGRTSTEAGDPVSMDEVREVATDIAAEAAHGFDVPLETVGLVGKPSSEIIQYANDQGARYIVLGPRKRSPVGKMVFGSVAQSVLLNADVPVVTRLEK
jgi:nucleotide-binding universal stress UspA family protein